MTDYPFAADARLLRWIDSSSAGRTITLELPPNEGEGHPFKGFPVGPKNGQRFRMSFEPIGDDEQPISRDPGETQERRPEGAHIPVGRRSTPQTTPAGAFHPKDPAKVMRGKEQYASKDEAGKLIAKAAILAKDPRFQDWIGRAGEADAKAEIHSICGVESCDEFHASDEARRCFKNLTTDFDFWSRRLPEPR